MAIVYIVTNDTKLLCLLRICNTSSSLLFYSTRRFVLCLNLVLFLFLCFAVLLELRLPRLGSRELILLLFVRLFDLCLFCFVLSVSSSPLYLERAAVCDCGTPWTFLLLFVSSLENAYIGCPGTARDLCNSIGTIKKQPDTTSSSCFLQAIAKYMD